MKKVLFFSALFFFQVALAKGVYQTPEAFLGKAFGGNTPALSSIWLTKEKKDVIAGFLQHAPSFIRIKYWQHESKTAWILNEVGKTKPITVGVVIESGKIQTLKVLTFRESRGWEVKHDFFTRQFDNVGINKEQKLDKSIDGISGATLSVRALKKIARIALYLEKQL
ncbi:MAG: FMN-binding protein [Cycloclasticus sp.]|nr:FMN-binding protein [Cycloclasticus sp.]